MLYYNHREQITTTDKRKEIIMKKLNKFEIIGIIVLALLTIWFFASWIDVVVHNDLIANPTKNSWNMFVWLINAAA